MEDQSTSYNYTLIIPHYNIPKLLRRCLRTVPKRDDLQVIVVDDCSTNELEELEKVKQEYDWVEWYDTGTNGGGGKSRNIGLQHAKGKYLIFADADDYFVDDIIEIWDNAITDDSVDIFYFSIESRESNTGILSWRHLNKIKSIQKLKNKKKDFDKWLRFCYTEPWGKLIRRNLILKYDIIFKERMVANDFYFSIKLGYFARKVKFIDKIGYIYTVRQNSISFNQLESPQRIINRLKSYYEVEIFAKENNIGIYPFSRFFIAIYFKHKDCKKFLNEFIDEYKLSYCTVFSLSLLKAIKFELIHFIFHKDVISNY